MRQNQLPSITFVDRKEFGATNFSSHSYDTKSTIILGKASQRWLQQECETTHSKGINYQWPEGIEERDCPVEKRSKREV